MKHPAAPTKRGRDGATCFAGVALATQVESLLAPCSAIALRDGESAEPLAKPGRNPVLLCEVPP